MKLWINSNKPAPKDYVWCKTIKEAKQMVEASEADCKYHWRKYGYIGTRMQIVLINIAYEPDILLFLAWLSKRKKKYQFHIHETNEDKILELRMLIEEYGWNEVSIVAAYEPKDMSRCNRCIHECVCPKDKDKERKCPHYKKDPPDGGYYG